ncbi:hypothetical protein KBD49_10470 [Myxococcota bacterium]|nr:hypothetical protein [Myxococcota bacterium]
MKNRLGGIGWLLIGGLLAIPACGGGNDGGSGDLVPADVPAEAAPDVVPDGPAEETPEAIPGDLDGTPDFPDSFPDGTAGDPGTDEDTAGCEEGSAWCSGDGYVAYSCTGGRAVETRCMEDQGRLCERGACVDPWAFGSPVFGTCPEVQDGTPETLSEKAAYYDAIARRLHIHPDLRWIMSVTLRKEEVTCPEGTPGPCHAPPDPDRATWQDVARWHTGENDGLWSALYLASQAFRYAVTRSEEALDTIRLLLQGEVTRMKVTGVPGLFTRQFIPPGIPGISCPDPDAQKAAYTTDAEKDDNRWVQVRNDGCIWVVDRTTGQWTTTPAGVDAPRCGLEEYAGWCWLDNVSQDEYAGHMLALGALWKLVDDPGVRATVKDLLTQVARHLVDHDLYFVDWDGRQTEHGKLHALSFADSPGFLSAMSMAYILLGAEASGDPSLRAYYDECLVQSDGQCEGWPYPEEGPYPDYLPVMLLYVGPEGCLSNYNNFSMVFSSLQLLTWFEQRPALREKVQEAFDKNFMREADQPRALIVQRNPWFNFGWGAFKRLGPGSDGPAFQAVEEGICSLRQFPARKVQVARDTESRYPPYCKQRNGDMAAEHVIPVNERCVSTFEWWGDPYDRETCAGDPWTVKMPADYLLPYWMGRYFGFLPEAL